MSKNGKKFFIVLFLLVSVVFGQSFTYTGPTSATVPFGSNSVNATFNFSYSNLDGEHHVIYPALMVSVNNSVICNYSLCNNPQTPSTYVISFTPGVHKVKFTLMSVNWYTLNCYDPTIWQTVEFDFTCKFKISVENIFTNGSIYADGNRDSPFHRPSTQGDYVSIGAIEQNYDNYWWVWNSNGTYNSEWQRIPSGIGGAPFSSSQNTSYGVQSSDQNTRVVAALRKLCSVTFQNSGSIYVNNNTYSNSATVAVVEQNTVTASCPNTSNAEIDGIFTGWYSGGNYFGYQITINAHGTYTPTFTYKPSTASRNLTFSSNGLNQIILSWSTHQTCTVYRVYRSVGKINPTVSLLTTTSNTTYTDPDYINTGNMEDEWIHYDVRPVYNNVESDPDWEGPIFGLNWVAKNENIESIGLAHEVPTEYSISNYPNPFNPETTINYQLPEKSFVSIKVYDILGKEVAELVNENKSAGYYKVNFDGGKLTSGIYIATIQANKFSKSIKILLTK